VGDRLVGPFAATVSNGERREFGPGELALVEDVTGEGHLTTPLTPNPTFAMIPDLRRITAICAEPPRTEHRTERHQMSALRRAL
jgi:hypothetical protein